MDPASNLLVSSPFWASQQLALPLPEFQRGKLQKKQNMYQIDSRSSFGVLDEGMTFVFTSWSTSDASSASGGASPRPPSLFSVERKIFFSGMTWKCLGKKDVKKL